jgi:hypothetical protein
MMKMRSMTQEVVVDVLVTMHTSPDVPTTNDASKGVNGVRSLALMVTCTWNGHPPLMVMEIIPPANHRVLCLTLIFHTSARIIWRMTMKLGHLQPSALVNIQTLIKHLLPM